MRVGGRSGDPDVTLFSVNLCFCAFRSQSSPGSCMFEVEATVLTRFVGLAQVLCVCGVFFNAGDIGVRCVKQRALINIHVEFRCEL